MLILALLMAAATVATTKVAVPGGAGGIGFDDPTFSAGLHRLLVPGGRSGKLDLYDPVTKEVTSISGFSQETEFGGGHGEGTKSGSRSQEPSRSSSFRFRRPEHPRPNGKASFT
jgi:hypothetical protein